MAEEPLSFSKNKKVYTFFFLLGISCFSMKSFIKHKISIKKAYDIRKNYADCEEKNEAYYEAYGQYSSNVFFDKKGIDTIALITMIKDEEDIVFENLVWHFCVGFRKFIIIDNNSTDRTRDLVEKFRRRCMGKAIVLVVDDPIIEHIQSRMMTGAMLMAHSIWPEVQWVFPVDGDEFFCPRKSLKNILDQISLDKNVILFGQYNYCPTKKHDSYDFQKPFYENLIFRTKLVPKLGKIALRPRNDLVISQGNHRVFTKQDLSYIAAGPLGLNMFHFQRRSPHQVAKKYMGGARANLLGKKLGILSWDCGNHWDAFYREAEKKGVNQAAIDSFNSHMLPIEKSVKDPLPMAEAFRLFEELVGPEKKTAFGSK
jgi:hypothetical protein